jgi:hypothetical protein
MLLWDYTNSGIIYVSENNLPSMLHPRNKWIFSILRSCILDTQVSRMPNTDSMYNELNNTSITNSLYMYSAATNSVRIGNLHESNELFVEKRNKAQLIAPLATSLINMLYSRLWRTANEIGIEIYDTLETEIIKSDPTQHRYSTGILDYAETLEITPAQAYIEIKLECETYNSIKLRAYAVSKKYQKLIREVSTQSQADELLQEMQQKLVAETYL